MDSKIAGPRRAEIEARLEDQRQRTEATTGPGKDKSATPVPGPVPSDPTPDGITAAGRRKP